MTQARDWWPLISVQDRADVLKHLDAADSGPLPTALADHILRAGGDLIAVDGMELDTDSPWALSDDDVDWIYAHGTDPVAQAVSQTDGRSDPA